MAEPEPRLWQVAALCRALADALDARFNPVSVQGEISGFTRASSGHCYFSLKDASAQIRCVMFKRAAGLLDFAPRDGQQVELRGRLSLYEPRGDLQLMVESMRQAGAGALFEQFLRLKARLDAEGLFDGARKRGLPSFPRGIGVVTSLSAAALRDVVTALQRRAAHVPVFVVPAQVQGAGAAADMVRALDAMYRMAQPSGHSEAGAPKVDVILLVRGGGSIEDLWALNDEGLARTIVRSPVPVVSGVGHETDFTIADFVADLRAPTPTAAAELAATARTTWLDGLDVVADRLQQLVWRKLDQQAQRIDGLAARLGRPSALAAGQGIRLQGWAQRLQRASMQSLRGQAQRLDALGGQLPVQVRRGMALRQDRLGRAQLKLGLLDPTLVLQRGYAWLVDGQGRTITEPASARPGDRVRATLASGVLNLQVPEQD